MAAAGDIGTRRWLLVSDIDDTLTGDDAAMGVLGEALLAGRDRLWFAVNSSRPLASVSATLTDVFPASLVPDAVITALGTEVAMGGGPLPGWQDRFAGWPQTEIYSRIAALGHAPHAAIYNTAFKVSFAVPQEAQAEVRAALEGLPCRIIASGTDDFDVIPPNAGKGAAALHLAEVLGVAEENLLVAGDSGNDLAMFGVSKAGIAVGNARAELVEALPAGSFYHAKAPHAGGVLEGLRHYGVLPQ
ncbi:HAD-IIB family hydrolase [Pseudoruegeria sp. HB172150]|uniref:HAD-IIB family hydrolase n=1 Tax=Pseudoruegeria sp. HB172150 TaxID=2721164 RepID=UPI001557B1FC|nr:HAD-IIB family hydrolase [Pseudoruegeria sp. HB172150]